METQWITAPGNMKKLLWGLVALNLIACSTILFITASGQGPLYEAIKPRVVNEYYVLQNQYVGDIVVGTTVYQDILIFDVIPLGENMIAKKPPHKLYFAKEHVERFDLQDEDIIVCSWLVQVTGEKRITNVVSYDNYVSLQNMSLLICQ